MEYDKNGNILNLRRNGDLDSDSSFMYAQEMDVLGYTYKPDSNLLLSVSDDTANPKGFNDGNTQNDDFEYDNNGNMIVDLNKNIKNITYNHLNLPTKILFGNSNYITYLYTASGQKVNKVVNEAGVITTTDYINGFQYKTLPSGDGGLVFFPHAEGYVNVNKSYKLTESSLYNYVFNYTDHLGNIRMSYTQAPTGSLSILEENHYYPFGLKHTNYNSDKRLYVRESVASKIKPVTPLFPLVYNYKYNGKEWQDELGLNVYDYGARFYSPDAPRWWQVDIKAEKYTNLSPYTYVADNPIANIDPDGKEIIFIVRGENGKKDQGLTYRKGNFYHNDSGKRYNPSKERLSPTLYKVLSTYRKIESSGDNKLKSVLHHLEKSKLKHYAEDGEKVGEKSHVSPYGLPTGPDKDDPIGTRTYYNFSEEESKRFKESEGIPDSVESIVVHEMRHQFDDDIGNSGDNSEINNEKDPSEIRAVFFENLMRKILKQMERKTYDKPIDPEKLKNPPNNIFK